MKGFFEGILGSKFWCLSFQLLELVPRLAFLTCLKLDSPDHGRIASKFTSNFYKRNYTKQQGCRKNWRRASLNPFSTTPNRGFFGGLYLFYPSNRVGIVLSTHTRLNFVFFLEPLEGPTSSLVDRENPLAAVPSVGSFSVSLVIHMVFYLWGAFCKIKTALSGRPRKLYLTSKKLEIKDASL